MGQFPKIFNDLITSLARFPGIGRRSAERIAFFILRMPKDELKELARRMSEVQDFIKPCAMCNNFTTLEICSFCSSIKREKDVVCIVEEPKDVVAIEKTSQYNGLYYVLLGSISPLEGMNSQDLNLGKLIHRIQKGEIKEIIISTDPDNDGELTAQYLIKKLSVYPIKIYRIAIGIPLGTQIEYIDSATLGKALLEKKSVI